MRRTNAVDFWRGLALVMIFVDHIPGNYFSSFTLHNFAISDAAELFVFLAGWSMSLATGGPSTPDRSSKVVFRLASRTIEIYRAQIVITAIAIAILSSTALALQNPLFLEWHNAGPVFFDPYRAILGWVVLTHHLGYFDILPLYVVLLGIGPALVLLGRRSQMALLALSLLIYSAALVTATRFPTWPGTDGWFFNPLSWQLIFVLGFLGAERTRTSAGFADWLWKLRPAAVVVVIAGLIIVKSGWEFDPLRVPEPRLLFVYDKTFLTPARLINFLALVITFQGVYERLVPYVPLVVKWSSSLGRNSLAVFCVGSVASLVGQIVRYVTGGGF